MVIGDLETRTGLDSAGWSGHRVVAQSSGGTPCHAFTACACPSKRPPGCAPEPPRRPDDHSVRRSICLPAAPTRAHQREREVRSCLNSFLVNANSCGSQDRTLTSCIHYMPTPPARAEAFKDVGPRPLPRASAQRLATVWSEPTPRGHWPFAGGTEKAQFWRRPC